MDIEDLRKIIAEFPKYPGTQNVSPASVCNEGFPGTFNLSYSEAEMVQLFGQYLDYDKDFVYSKIQPVIRFQDWSHIENSDEHSYRYLSVFDLADIGGAIILKDAGQLDNVINFSIASFADFLFNKIGLDKSKIRISVFSGGNVKDVTKGKYNLDLNLPAEQSYKHWEKFGISEEQFIEDKSRDTLLALNIFGRPTPWGFRHEINYLHNGKLLDIGTFEYLLYRPVFDGETVVGLKKWEHLFVISAVGLERLLMVKNNLNRAIDCPHILPLVEGILNLAKNNNRDDAEVLCQALRVVHRVIADCGNYESLSARRKEKMRTFFKSIVKCCQNLDIALTKQNLVTLVSLNAELQKYYPELNKNVDKLAEIIIEANQRIKNDKSIKGGVAQ